MAFKFRTAIVFRTTTVATSNEESGFDFAEGA